MPTLAALCLREVADTHTLIAQWLADAGCPDTVLDALLQRFEPDFSMIPPNGAQLEEGALPSLFASLRGSRAGLRIEIDALTIVHQDAGSAMVTYRERQTWNQGASTRRATALFVLAGDARVTWRHLHETWA